MAESNSKKPAARTPQQLALDAFTRYWQRETEQSRPALTVRSADDGPSYKVWPLGTASENRYLIITAPTNADKAFVAVIKGQTLICDWFNAATAFRFRATIAKLVFDPAPVVYLEMPASVEHKPVRRVPRVKAVLPGLVRTTTSVECVVADLSIRGARIGLPDTLGANRRDEVYVAFRVRVLDQDFLVDAQCTVAAEFGKVEPQHPELRFYGLDFNSLSQFDQMVLHAFVQERIATETDWLSRVLAKKTG